jgi:hypothetical protein
MQQGTSIDVASLAVFHVGTSLSPVHFTAA